MKKKYTWKILGMVVCLMLSLFVVSCQKDKDEITEEQARIVIENVKLVKEEVTPFFMSSESVEEMASHLEEIKKLNYVEDAWQDNNTIALKIKDGGIIRWCFFPVGDSDGKTGILLDKIKYFETKGDDNAVCENKNVCIAITTPFDESRASFRLSDGTESDYYKSWKSIKDAFEKKGYKVCPKSEEEEYEFYYGNEITPNFYSELLPEFGVNIIITHGDYIKGIHWIMTGEEENPFSSQMYFTPWDKNDLEPWVIKEERNGIKVEKSYYAISQNYLASHMKKSFSNNSIMFIWACKTMMDNYDFSDFFRDRGLGCYFGYDNSVSRDRAGEDLAYLMQYMLYEGLTAGEAYHKSGKGSNPQLLLAPENSDITLVKTGKKAYFCRFWPYYTQFPRFVRKIVFDYNSSVSSGDRLYSEESDVPIYGNENGNIYTISTSLSEIFLPDSCSFFNDLYYVDEIDFGEGLNTSEVTCMRGMFSYCTGLKQLLHISNWNTSNVTDMRSMFDHCESMTSLNLSGWNTENVTDMGSMFDHCESMTSLNLSGWNTENVTDMSQLFYYCKNLTSLNLSGWNTENVTDMGEMFEGCSSLTSLNIANFYISSNCNKLNMCQGLARTSNACTITCTSDTRDELQVRATDLIESYITWNIVGKKK